MEQSTLRRQGLGVRGVDIKHVSPGYILFAHLTSNGVVRLIDSNGKDVHRWMLPHRVGRHARLLLGGVLAVNCVHPEGPNLFPLFQKYRGGLMLQLDSNSNIISSYSDPLAHHDQNHLTDGTLLYTSLHALSSDQARSIQGGIPNSEAPGNKVYADMIKHVDPSKPEKDQVLWEWRAIDHLDPSKFPLQSYPREHWPLINSVERLSDGNILASLRSVSAVIVIDYTTKNVIWHLDSSIVAQQHCASELIDQKGRTKRSFLIFDNGVFRTGESLPYSRVLQVAYSPDDPSTDKQIIWKYQDPNVSLFFSPFMGSAQRLANGNTFIAQSHTGRLFEVTKEGKMVWEYIIDDFANYEGFNDGAEKELAQFFSYPANAVFRAYKYRPEELPWLGGSRVQKDEVLE